MSQRRKWSFTCDEEFNSFCDEIIAEMVKLHEISEEEAAGRIDRHWKGQQIVGPDNMVYHEEPDFWANTVYYGPEAFWWMEDVELNPLPYP